MRLLSNLEKEENRFWHFAVLVSSETGLRLGDICQLDWNCFTKPGRLVLHTDKRNKRIDIPISNAISKAVTEIPVADERYLFPEQRATIVDVKRRVALSMQFKRICERLGIKDKSFHCLRHSAATSRFTASNKAELAKKLVDALSLQEIANLLGHSETKTTKRYVH